MEWKRQPALERGVEIVAALCLGGAAGFALWSLVPLAGLVAAAIGGLLCAGGGYALLRRIGAAAPDSASFEPVELESEGDELLLDDPIPALDPDSRVVRLFEPDQPVALPEPGELVTRIADYLGSGRSVTALPDPVRNDASAALHAALADIRRSLR